MGRIIHSMSIAGALTRAQAAIRGSAALTMLMLATTLTLPASWGESGDADQTLSEWSTLSRLTIPLVFVDQAYEPAEIPEGHDYLLTLNPISGDLYGATEDHQIPIDVSAEQTLTLFPRYIHTVGLQFAEQADLQDLGVTVTPEETRITRFGTFLNDRQSDQSWGTGFKDLETGDSLLLIYVDRPCRIQGAATLPTRSGSFDIHIPNPGLNWVRVVKNGTAYDLSWMAHPTRPALFGLTD